MPDLPSSAVEGQPEPGLQSSAGSSVLGWMPAPVPTATLGLVPPGVPQEMESSKLYLPYDVVSGFRPDYSHAPSLSMRPRSARASGKDRQPCLAARLCATVHCGVCKKPRAVFCQSTLSTLQADVPGLLPDQDTYVLDQVAMAREDDTQWVCGAVFFPPEHRLHGMVYTSTDVQCASSVENALYGANKSKLRYKLVDFQKSLCSVCGLAQVSMQRLTQQLGCDPEQPFSGWQQYPLCDECEQRGCEAEPVQIRTGTKRAAQQKVVNQKRSRGRGARHGLARGRGQGRGRGRAVSRVQTGRSDSSQGDDSVTLSATSGSDDAAGAAPSADVGGPSGAATSSHGSQRPGTRSSARGRSDGIDGIAWL
jgi:hypothetical protein